MLKSMVSKKKCPESRKCGDYDPTTCFDVTDCGIKGQYVAKKKTKVQSERMEYVKQTKLRLRGGRQ